MLSRIKALIAENFRSREFRTKRLVDTATGLLKQFELFKPEIQIAITPSSQLILIEKETLIVLGIIELRRVAYEASVLFNSLAPVSEVTTKIEYLVKDAIKGEVLISSMALAYNPNLPIILMGDAAEKYMKQPGQAKAPSLSVVRPQDLN